MTDSTRANEFWGKKKKQLSSEYYFLFFFNFQPVLTSITSITSFMFTTFHIWNISIYNLGEAGWKLGDNYGTCVQASISKPTSFIYLAFEKTDPFIYLIVWNVDLFIYCPLIFYTHSYRIYSLLFAYKFTNKKKNAIVFHKLNTYLSSCTLACIYTNSAIWSNYS